MKTPDISRSPPNIVKGKLTGEMKGKWEDEDSD
jgi:hypothetical protein